MAYDKLATCCYCGAHELLRWSGEGRTELTCGSCGAPFSRLKSIKRREAAEAEAPRRETQGSAGKARPSKPRRSAPASRRPDATLSSDRRSERAPSRPVSRRRPKRSRSIVKRLFRALDDIVDEFEDLLD